MSDHYLINQTDRLKFSPRIAKWIDANAPRIIKQPCDICSAPGPAGGYVIHLPDPEDIYIPQGKIMIMLISICDNCAARLSKAELVKAVVEVAKLKAAPAGRVQ